MDEEDLLYDPRGHAAYKIGGLAKSKGGSTIPLENSLAIPSVARYRRRFSPRIVDTGLLCLFVFIPR